MSKYNILFQLSGSIACYKSADLISYWVQQGHEVEVITTPSALKFIGEATLEGLTGKPVHKSLWESGDMMNHIDLARWCDFAVLCPASAHHINALAHGQAQDLIGTLFLAFERDKPYFIAPAMNSKMYSHPIVQNSLRTLKNLGCSIFKTDSGTLACGEVGEGRLLNIEQIKNEIQSYMESQNPELEEKKILITSGGTSEAIDSVRSITNTSTGSTGAILADHFQQKGWDVTLLKSERGACPNHSSIEQHSFLSFQDLEQKLSEQLKTKSFDTIIHLAAVSDFSVDYIDSGSNKTTGAVQGKLTSQQAPIIHLKKNQKLVNQIKTLSRNKKTRLVAFKLTDTLDPKEQAQAVKTLLDQSNADIIVHNDYQSISSQSHRFNIYLQNHPPLAAPNVSVHSKKDLAIQLENTLQEENR